MAYPVSLPRSFEELNNRLIQCRQRRNFSLLGFREIKDGAPLISIIEAVSSHVRRFTDVRNPGVSVALLREFKILFPHQTQEDKVEQSKLLGLIKKLSWNCLVSTSKEINEPEAYNQIIEDLSKIHKYFDATETRKRLMSALEQKPKDVTVTGVMQRCSSMLMYLSIEDQMMRFNLKILESIIRLEKINIEMNFLKDGCKKFLQNESIDFDDCASEDFDLAIRGVGLFNKIDGARGKLNEINELDEIIRVANNIIGREVRKGFFSGRLIKNISLRAQKRLMLLFQERQVRGLFAVFHVFFNGGQNQYMQCCSRIFPFLEICKSIYFENNLFEQGTTALLAGALNASYGKYRFKQEEIYRQFRELIETLPQDKEMVKQLGLSFPNKQNQANIDKMSPQLEPFDPHALFPIDFAKFLRKNQSQKTEEKEEPEESKEEVSGLEADPFEEVLPEDAPLIENLVVESRFPAVFSNRVERWFTSSREPLDENEFPEYIGHPEPKRMIDFHGFSKRVDSFFDIGIQTVWQNPTTGKMDATYLIPAEINGIRGAIAYCISAQDGKCYHRYFQPMEMREILDKFGRNAFQAQDFPELSSEIPSILVPASSEKMAQVNEDLVEEDPDLGIIRILDKRLGIEIKLFRF